MESENDYLAIFVTLAALLYLLEGMIPKPFPWLKLGLANIITVIGIYFFDFRFVVKLIFLRVFAGALITATLFTPAFFLSLSGGLAAVIAMFITFTLFKNYITPVGVSLIGAETHILTQLVVIYFFIIKDKVIFSILPLLLIISLFTGIFIGYISNKVIANLDLAKREKKHIRNQFRV
jgi:heptaprenyl diphosphate synthase